MSSAPTRAPRGLADVGAVARAVAATTLALSCAAALAQAQSVAPQDGRVRGLSDASSSLERAFWACDHAATRHPLDSGDAMACSVVSENLKRTRFGGDFDAMLAWWRKNRVAEHRALDAVGRELANR